MAVGYKHVSGAVGWISGIDQPNSVSELFPKWNLETYSRLVNDLMLLCHPAQPGLNMHCAHCETFKGVLPCWCGDFSAMYG